MHGLAGAIQGSFGAGVAVEAKKRGLYRRVRVFVGESCSNLNFMFSIANQIHLEHEIYAHVAQDKFMRPWLTIPGIVVRAIDRFIKSIDHTYIFKAVDIDLLFDLMETNARFCPDFESAYSALGDGTEFLVAIADPIDAQVHLVPIQEGGIALLKASTALVPYYNRAIELDIPQCKLGIDASLVQSTCIRQIIPMMRTGEKIIIIAQGSFERKLRHHCKDWCEAQIAGMMFESKALRRAMKNRISGLYADLQLIMNLEYTGRAIVVQPDPGCIISPAERDSKKIRRSYEHGLEKGAALCSDLGV